MHDLQLQAAIIESDRLPPVPADPRGMGRHVSWAIAAQAPHFHYGPHKIEVTPAWIDARVKAFADHNESKPGWIPPIQVGHTDTGEREGDFFAARHELVGKVQKDGSLDWSNPVPTLLGALAWNDADAETKIKEKRLTHVSIGLRNVQRPDTGEGLEGVPIEITKTALPHLGQALILNEAQSMDEQTTAPAAVEAAEPEAMDPQAAMLEMLATISAKLDALMPAEEEPAEADEEETSMAAQLVELNARLALAEERAAEADKEARWLSFSQAYPEGGSIAMTADVRRYLFEANEIKPEGFEAVEGAWKGPKAPEVKATVPAPIVVKRANPWDHRVVTTGHANPPKVEAPAVLTLSAIRAEATDEKGNVDEVKALELLTKHRLAGRKIVEED